MTKKKHLQKNAIPIDFNDSIKLDQTEEQRQTYKRKKIRVNELMEPSCPLGISRVGPAGKSSLFGTAINP